MTKDDISRMAREAGMHDPMIFIGAYERFANRVYVLAAEREREACAKVCDGYTGPDYDTVSDILAAAIRARSNT